MCSFDLGGSPVLEADLSTPEEGGTLLMPYTLSDGTIVVLSIIQNQIAGSAWEEDHDTIQSAFWTDVENSISYPSYAFSVGDASGVCQ